jgi:hypothetical protein
VCLDDALTRDPDGSNILVVRGLAKKGAAAAPARAGSLAVEYRGSVYDVAALQQATAHACIHTIALDFSDIHGNDLFQV